MAYNIDLLASLKVSKPDNNSKAVGFSSSAAERPYDFRDSLKAAVRSRSQNEMKADSSIALRKELVSKSESKLNSLKKPEIKDMDNDKPVEESAEKQTDKKEMTIEEILSKLEELAELQQMGAVPADKLTVMLENVKEALKELAAVQPKSIAGLEAENLQIKAAELTAVLEGMQEDLRINGSLTDNKSAEDFAAELKTMLTQESSKSETLLKAAVDNKTAENSMKPETNMTNTTETNDVEIKNETVAGNTAQRSEESNNLTAESKQANEAAENKNQDIKAEASVVNTKPVSKEAQPAAEESEDDVKTALNSKVEKVTVENKESKKQDAEAGTNKEAAKEVCKAANTTQEKSVNEEMIAIKLEQTVIDKELEAIQNQAAAPKAQTVNKEEVINQIVKKAEIIFTDAQPEIRMQLEPENLGKLTLSIAVEKGLITAKFVAESHEVKQIIESSFNELKDMLNEKGLGVQNLSVSVGQENREYNNSNAFQQWKETVKLNGRSMNSGNYEGYLDGEGTVARAVNPYSVHNGEFDHRA